MLPSTGYFKTINCPFYNSGLCERPYCHFKHTRRDDAATTTTTLRTNVAAQVQSSEKSMDGEVSVPTTKTATTATTTTTTDPNLFEELVSQAVKKVLADHEVSETVKIAENIVSRVVGELNPPSSSKALKDAIISKAQSQACVYNPTPIAELKKRHIPITPYMPTKEIRLATKRKSSPDRFKPWLNLPHDVTEGFDQSLVGVAAAGILPNYSTVKVNEITYKPTAISNSVMDCNTNYVQNYVPTSMKSEETTTTTTNVSSPTNSYDDGNSSDYLSKVKDEYRPRSKKRREEYVPKKLKAPLKMDDNLVADVRGVENFDGDKFGIGGKFCNYGAIGDNNDGENNEYKNPKFSDDDEETETDVKVKDIVVDGFEKVDKENGNLKDIDKLEKSFRKVKDSDGARSSDKKDKREKDKRRNCEEVRNEDKDKDKDKDKRRRSSGSKDRRRSSSSRSRRSSKDRNSDNSKRDKRSSRYEKDLEKNDDKRGSKSKKKSSSSSTSSSRENRRRRSSSDKNDKTSRSSKSRRKSVASDSSRKSDIDTKKDEEDHDEKENSPLVSLRSPSPFDDQILEISDSDHDIEEECLKIFQEYEVSEHPKEPSTKQQQSRRIPEEPSEPGKQRVAHASASQYSEWKRTPSQPPKVIKNPQVRLTERWRISRDAMIAEKAAANPAKVSNDNQKSDGLSTTAGKPIPANQQQQQSPANKCDQLVNGNGKLRIAHVPYATSLALAKKKVSETMNKNLELKTVAQTAKGGSRVAHVPVAIPQLIRPEPLHVATQKFPLNVRQYYVNMMQDICTQIYTNGDDAAQRALREEYACHERCKAVAVYKNSCMLAAHRLRKELDQQSALGDSSSSLASGTVSHEAVLAGKSKGSWSVVRSKKSVTEFKGATLYTLLSKWIMTEEQLRENGFPRPHPDGPTGRVKIYVTNTRNQTILSKQPNERFCSRCNQPYMVDKHGNAVLQQNCIYHWGRKFTIRGEGKYSCCQQYGSAGGCCDAKTHVWDYVDYENLRGYVKTLPKDYIPVEEQGVFALDCEMSYTTQGLELTRVTVINEECNAVYETLVKPVHPVIDYNTRSLPHHKVRNIVDETHFWFGRFSGITEKDMEGVTTTLLDVQATLLSMFTDKTILIGHSLESDFKALKLVHDTVVDTSIMFPHRNGYPQKRALRNLCSEYLQKIIQNDVSGHDSNEDAVSCMELALWKLKEEAKSQ